MAVRAQGRTTARRRARALPAIGLVVLATLVATSCLTVTPGAMFLDAARAHDVNNQGIVVGSRWIPPPNTSILDHAYRFDLNTGTLTDLGTLGGNAASAEAINDADTIVGWSKIANGQQRAFILRSGTAMANLGVLTPAATTPESMAADVNADDLVVGWSNVETGTVDATRAFVWDPATSTMTDIGTLGGTDAAATAISDAGIVVGWSEVTGDAARHAFAYDLATGVMTDLGVPPGGVNSEAVDVNEVGQVAITGEVGGFFPVCGPGCPTTRAFVHDLTTGTTAQLGLPIGEDTATAAAINESGVVVGYSVRFEVSCSHCGVPTTALAWESGTTGAYRVATGEQYGEAINDAGLVVGTGNTRGLFSLVPFGFQGSATVIPDP